MSDPGEATTRGTVIHAAGESQPGHAYCGRSGNIPPTAWERVTCINCHAAHRADQEHLRR